MRKNNRSGFTLLEVIIVIIIIGVLASLALPRFFSTVEYSRATEAMQSLATVRQSVERCYLMRNSFAAPCNAFANLDVEDPGGVPNAHFTYGFTNTANAYTITATRNTRDGGSTANTVWLMFDGAAGTVSRGGTGAFGAVN